MKTIRAKAIFCAVWLLAPVAPGPIHAAPPAKREPAAPPSPSPGDRVTLSFRDSSIQEVFEVLSRAHKVNIVLGKGVTGQVSVNLYNATIGEAIVRVAEAAGYAVEVRGGDYLVVDRKEAGLDHPDGLTRLRTFKVQYSDPVKVGEILGKYLSRYGKITQLGQRRMIVVEDTPEFLARIERLLQEIDVEPRQVLIEAKVLEVTLGEGETYGVNWNNIFGSAAGSGTTGGFGTSGLTPGTVLTGPRQAGFFFSLTNKNLEAFLEAQTTRNRVRTLSTPRLLALENQEAKVVIGNSTGYKVTTTINQVTTESIQFLESGVILKVTPTVDQQDRVMLKVHPEVSSATVSALGIPDKKSTEVTTELLCEDGQSVFIGGLIKNSSSVGKTGVPILGDLPGIGVLFSANKEEVGSTETIVIITPRIVRTPGLNDAASASNLTTVGRNLNLMLDHRLKLLPTNPDPLSGASDAR